MAKDLPYFKFYCSEWNDGDITLEDFNIQGLFINVCSYYWSNECNLTSKKLYKKFKESEKDVDYLISEGLIKVIDNEIFINFLDEQSTERQRKSLINKENGSKGGRPKKQTETENKPKALISLTETKGNKKRREEKREEEKRKEYNKENKFLNWFNTMLEIHKGRKGKFRTLTKTDENNYKKIIKAKYSKEDFDHAFKQMILSKWANENNMLSPSHFLRIENFNKYLNSELKQNQEISKQAQYEAELKKVLKTKNS